MIMERNYLILGMCKKKINGKKLFLFALFLGTSMILHPERIFAVEKEVFCVQLDHPQELSLLINFSSIQMKRITQMDQNVKVVMVGELWDDQGTIIWNRDQPEKFVFINNKVSPKEAESYIQFLKQDGISIDNFYQQIDNCFYSSLDDFYREEITESNCEDLIPKMKIIHESVLNAEPHTQEAINEVKVYFEKANFGNFSSERYYDCNEKRFIPKEEAANRTEILKIGKNRGKLYFGEIDEFGNESGQGILLEYVDSRFTDESFQGLFIKVGSFNHGFLNGSGKSYQWYSEEEIARLVEGEFKNGVLVGQATLINRPWTDKRASGSILMDHYWKYGVVPASEEKDGSGKILLVELSNGTKIYISEEYAREFGKLYC